MKFDDASRVQDVCWNMRRKELERSSTREILLRQFNGEPPFDEKTAEENGVEINRNFLKGVQVLADARRQWNQAFLSTPRYFSLKTDSGPVHKRDAWGLTITKHVNNYLKQSRGMMEQVRGTGANVILHGIGPKTWPDDKTPIPVVLPIDAVFIPLQTEIDFENLSFFAVYREYTPAQLNGLVSRDKNPGWNRELAQAVIKRAMSKDSKAWAGYPQTSPERYEETLKQDGGFWDSDAAPTIDCLDFYFREGDDGNGWYRRIVLDWDSEQIGESAERPVRNWNVPGKETNPDKNFLYTSKARPYCDSLSQILHCQFGDCSAYAPFKYHSVRSLGWLLWGVCDLTNRFECRFYEAIFENLMWFFRVAGENDMTRLKKAVFSHMGVIPNTVSFVSAQDRFTPNPNLVEQARFGLKSHIADAAASYTQDFDKGETKRELTATETMARVNSTNALVAGMMTLAYTYAEFEYAEITRRILDEDHPHSVKIRQKCMKDGVPQKMLDSERWRAQAERVIGAGNKTVEMAAIQFLQTIREKLPPASQRKVDNLSIRAVSEQPDLADDLAPLDEIEKISNSQHDAELASERIFRGLPFTPPPNAVYEDYIATWLKDLALTVQRALAMNSATVESLQGMQNMAQHIGQFIQVISTNVADRPKVRVYLDALSKIMNHVRGLTQRLEEQMQKQGQGADPNELEAMAKLKVAMMLAQAKSDNLRESHAQKTAQRQVQFEMEEQRKDRAANAEIRRLDETAERKAPSISLSYKDTPDPVKRQIEAAAGYVPAPNGAPNANQPPKPETPKTDK